MAVPSPAGTELNIPRAVAFTACSQDVVGRAQLVSQPLQDTPYPGDTFAFARPGVVEHLANRDDAPWVSISPSRIRGSRRQGGQSSTSGRPRILKGSSLSRLLRSLPAASLTAQVRDERASLRQPQLSFAYNRGSIALLRHD
jgi:hypothetical protein